MISAIKQILQTHHPHTHIHTHPHTNTHMHMSTHTHKHTHTHTLTYSLTQRHKLAYIDNSIQFVQAGHKGLDGAEKVSFEVSFERVCGVGFTENSRQ